MYVNTNRYGLSLSRVLVNILYRKKAYRALNESLLITHKERLYRRDVQIRPGVPIFNVPHFVVASKHLRA